MYRWFGERFAHSKWSPDSVVSFENHWLPLLFIKSTNCNNILLIITVFYALDGVFPFCFSIHSFNSFGRSFARSFSSLEFVMTLNLMIVHFNVILQHTVRWKKAKQRETKKNDGLEERNYIIQAIFTRTHQNERALNIVQMTLR